MTATPITGNSEDVSQILVNIVIPPCPKIVVALVQEAQTDEPDLAKLDKLLSGDVGLAAAILKTANSPYYGLSRKAQAVKQAILVLGIRMVTNIVTLLALQKALAVPAGSLDRFWDRSNYHAIVCGRLARYLRSISSDGAFTFGLFNDCGIPVLAQHFPDYKETLRLANSSDRPFIDIENERHHTSHVTVGAILARSWHLPEIICQAIQHHHAQEVLYSDPPSTDGDVSALCALSLIHI